jgi:hypothetical protein
MHPTVSDKGPPQVPCGRRCPPAQVGRPTARFFPQRVLAPHRHRIRYTYIVSLARYWGFAMQTETRFSRQPSAKNQESDRPGITGTGSARSARGRGGDRGESGGSTEPLRDGPQVAREPAQDDAHRRESGEKRSNEA